MSRSRRNNFFAGMMHGRRSLVRDLRDPVWDAFSNVLAERFLFDKYRQGVHPDYVEWEVRQELAMTLNGGYNYHYLRCLLDMHARLRLAGSFHGLPSLVELEAERILDKRIRLKQMIKDRFMRESMDTMLHRNTESPRGSDHNTDHGSSHTVDSRSDENASLRRDVADLAFRVESAEARLDIQSRSSMGRRPDSTHSHHGNGCNGNHMPMPQQAQMQSGCAGSSVAYASGRRKSTREVYDRRGGGQLVVYDGPRSNMGGRDHGPNHSGYDRRSQNHQFMQNGGQPYQGGFPRDPNRYDGRGGLRY